MEVTKNEIEAKGNGKFSDVQSPRLKSEPPEKKMNQQEVPSIRLSPEQIEEIHSDEYALTLFYATRVEPLSVAEIKKQFPEPEPKKAQSVLDRFIKVGLIHITQDGQYYSNFPENYINYAHYRYDSDLEARKDSKVFRLMKEFTGNKEYWKNKSYFSMDAFYTEEQTKEMQEMFRQIKLKAKEYANENSSKKSIKGLFFRRMKFFDMTFSILFGFFLVLGVSNQARAGGNDPIMRMASYQQWISGSAEQMRLSGGGNDPTASMMFAPGVVSTAQVYSVSYVSKVEASVDSVPSTSPDDGRDNDGGGGHDPTQSCPNPTIGGGGHDPNPPRCCVPDLNGNIIPVYSERLCKAQDLLLELMLCQQKSSNCVDIEKELYNTLFRTNGRAN